ncbi:hypothetical protein CTA2_13054 [Colletotrichum tanaceti]|uniref:Uncharacterized protein n=1 Tax=Colletotrichum tanaceti TaxID=1306861 RepID=A0A4U6XA18_9PEZI|nr:hypothetical protein CTA2_13054 [Colletotrichum tanaceti]TKW50507.1 hypothetical protein CTA1_10711 [Colletotrichum tanaceti]
MESLDDMLYLGLLVEIVESTPSHTRPQTPSTIPPAAVPYQGCDGATNAPITLRLRPTAAEAKPESLVSGHPTRGTEVEDLDTEMTDAPALEDEEARTGAAPAEDRPEGEEIGYGSEMSGVEYSSRSASLVWDVEDVMHISIPMDME